MDFERVALPGVGVNHTFVAESGQRLGVITHANGRRDIVTYDADDLDTVRCEINLNVEEAQAVGDLLGATAMIDHVRHLEEPVHGIHVLRVPVRTGSPYADRPVSDARRSIGDRAAIVGIASGGRLIATPRPDTVLRAGDEAVVAGDDAGTIAATRLLLGEQ